MADSIDGSRDQMDPAPRLSPDRLRNFAAAVYSAVGLCEVDTQICADTLVVGPYQAERRSRAGHLFIALNIAALQPLSEFNERMESLISQIKSVPLAQGFDKVFYPGEIEARNDVLNRRQGLLLPADTLRDLEALAREHALEKLLPF